VCTASRSEWGLIQPVLRRLERSPFFNVHTLFIQPGSFQDGYTIGRQSSYLDLAITPFDRFEMLGAAIGFYEAAVPTAQIHAGDLSLEGTLDDYARHMITLTTSIQFCCSPASYLRTMQFLELVGKDTDRCYEVGSIHMDDLQIDYSACPGEPFDLVLYNPPTRRLDLMKKELDEIERLIGDRLVVWIEPNEDPGRRYILYRIQKIILQKDIVLQNTLPRPSYLGLLERCERAIGNSSSFFYELPYFGKRHIHVGVRNKGRETPEIRPGGSDRIVAILEKLWRNGGFGGVGELGGG